jgi:hypothetical protein
MSGLAMRDLRVNLLRTNLLTAGLLVVGLSSVQAATLQQCGQGAIEVTAKTVGQATLFLQDCQQPWQGQPIRLRFSYQANVPGWAFRKAANVLLARNLSSTAWNNHKTAYQAFTAQYQAIKSGDVYEISYQPAQERISFGINQNPVNQLKNQAYKDYLLIWLGDKPFSIRLKKQLLN